jgi:hypothetical protein
MHLPVIPEAEALAEAIRDLRHGHTSLQIPALRDRACSAIAGPG